jgi:hypothetical protein
VASLPGAWDSQGHNCPQDWIPFCPRTCFHPQSRWLGHWASLCLTCKVPELHMGSPGLGPPVTMHALGSGDTECRLPSSCQHLPKLLLGELSREQHLKRDLTPVSSCTLWSTFLWLRDHVPSPSPGTKWVWEDEGVSRSQILGLSHPPPWSHSAPTVHHGQPRLTPLLESGTSPGEEYLSQMVAISPLSK